MNIPLAGWLAYWRYRRWYHGYTVEGLEHLDGPHAKLIVGYHGRPMAYDMCMLTVALYERLGYLPHGIAHRGTDLIPPMKWLVDGLGFVLDDGDAVAAAVRRGEHIVTTPGGANEGCRSYQDVYRVNWGHHSGYARLAVRHGMSIVPVGARGADDGYIGLNEGPVLGKQLGLPKDVAWMVWIGLGPLGIWPWSPPFPVRMHQIVGEPIDPRSLGVDDPNDEVGIARLHKRVTGAVQSLLDRARSAA